MTASPEMIAAALRACRDLGSGLRLHGRIVLISDGLLGALGVEPDDDAARDDDAEDTPGSMLECRQRVAFAVEKARRALEGLLEPATVAALASPPLHQPAPAPEPVAPVAPEPLAIDPAELPEAVRVGSEWHVGGKIGVREVGDRWVVFYLAGGSIISFEPSKGAAIETARAAAPNAPSPGYGGYASPDEQRYRRRTPRVITKRP
jgi:hypothetical protein